MKNDYLVEHALKNVWCAPDQDNQFLVKLHRITRLSGEANRVMVFNRRIPFPLLKVKYHVFTSDRLSPKQLKMLSTTVNWGEEVWFNVGDTINQTSLFVNIYNELGIEIPKYQSWYMLTKEGALIFAFQENDKIPINYKSEVVYFRTYTNAFYGSPRDVHGVDTNYYGLKVKTVGDTLALQSSFDALDALPGHVYCYINGVYTDKIDLVHVQLEDVAELVYDSSVTVVDKYVIKDMDTFNSTLDNVYKYLLMRRDSRHGVIDYLDDLDIHITADVDLNIYKGVYFHRNDEKSIRMLTHRDYSISVDNVVAMCNKLKEVTGTQLDNLEMYLEIKVRDSGLHRPLIYEINRIHELYKLGYEDRYNAVIGINALDIWRAEVLEQNSYVRLMAGRNTDFNYQSIEAAYGYNGEAKILADTPSKTHTYSGRQRVFLPQGLSNNSTFYEYDQDGTLLGWQYQSMGSEYLTVNNNARVVEGIYGYGTDRPDVSFGVTNILMPVGYNYRVYMCHRLPDGTPDEKWVDVTGKAEYTITNGYLINNNSHSDEYFMVRSDKNFLALNFNVSAIHGVLFFDLYEYHKRTTTFVKNNLPVPMGDLDIWLNNKSLVKDIDYYVDFPRVYIVSKNHMLDPTNGPQNIKVRFTGFCKENMELDDVEDFGFVEHGYLSNNNKFDIRDDKVMRMAIGGLLKTREDVQFSEEHSGVNIIHTLNGKPYQIKDIVVPITTYTTGNVYQLREQSIERDKVVSDYLSLKLPQPERNAVSAITERYPLYSPFFSRIISLMQSDVISDTQLATLSTDMSYMHFFGTYEYLLEHDPISKNISSDFVVIHPTISNVTTNLSLLKLRVLNKLVKLYGEEKITLSPFITL